MEIAPCQTHHYSSASPPPFASVRRLGHHQNVHRRSNLTMPLRDLTFRRIPTNQNHFRFNQAIQSFSVAKPHASINHRTMAEEISNTDLSKGQDATASSVTKTAEEQNKSTPVVSPTPPAEKPLPGDCCGSGCVRCVWDVYYEELEEYDRLCKADSKIS